MLEIRPITLKAANEFVRERHRHNGPTRGHKFSVAVYDGDKLVGVGIVGRPVARRLDDGLTAEILRICTDGTRNACSILYGACSRCAKEMGYKRVGLIGVYRADRGMGYTRRKRSTGGRRGISRKEDKRVY